MADPVISDHVPLGDSHIQSMVRDHAERLAPYADLFRRVLPEAVAAQARVFRLMNEERETARQSQREFETLLNRRQSREHELSPDSLARIQERIRGQAKSGVAPRVRSRSPQAEAMTLQPVRDIIVDNVVVIGEDRKLDILGAQYREAWSNNEIGNIDPGGQSMNPQRHWADVVFGEMGFEHGAFHEDTTSGAGLYVGFKPPIAPGIAQVRPYLPYSYKYFKGQSEDGFGGHSEGGFGILVWSWNTRGGDFATEEDYRYFVWSDSAGGRWNPSFFDHPGQPDLCFDSDYAFLYGTQAPYFSVRPDRIYLAAVWCFGACSEHTGTTWSDGRIHAELPWVVIGYQ